MVLGYPYNGRDKRSTPLTPGHFVSRFRFRTRETWGTSEVTVKLGERRDEPGSPRDHLVTTRQVSQWWFFPPVSPVPPPGRPVGRVRTVGDNKNPTSAHEESAHRPGTSTADDVRV